MPTPKISAVIITFNEEKNIARCISSLGFADEIIVYDGKSGDATREIAREAACRVILRDCWNGFGIAKQEAVAFAKNDYIFSIDADEAVSPELAESIRHAIAKASENGSGATFRTMRKNFFLGKEIKHSGWKNDAPVRLFDRRFANFNSAIVHEEVLPADNAEILDGFLLHYSNADLTTYTHKMLHYAEAAAEKKRTKGKTSSLTKAILAGAFKFVKKYFLQLGIFDGRHGLILALNSAYGEFYRYLLLIKSI